MILALSFSCLFLQHAGSVLEQSAAVLAPKVQFFSVVFCWKYSEKKEANNNKHFPSDKCGDNKRGIKHEG
jgi:hypothetical protein